MDVARRLVLVLFACVTLASCGASATAARPRFTPYLDVVQSSDPGIAAAVRDSGTKLLKLGFVVASRGACRPSWGGQSRLDAPIFSRQIRQARSSGADVVPAFGGAGGADLALACRTPGALANAYLGALRTLHARAADFDFEDVALGDRAAGRRLGLAIAQLERQRKGRVTLTLPVDPVHGLESPALRVLRFVRSAGGHVDVVNLLTQNFGDQLARPGADTMAGYSLRSANRAVSQLDKLWKRAGGWWHALGITPLIGVNDVSSEIFTLADAAALVDAARARGLAELGFWSVGRDRQCPAPTPKISPRCSGVTQESFAFSRAFRRVDA